MNSPASQSSRDSEGKSRPRRRTRLESKARPMAGKRTALEVPPQIRSTRLPGPELTIAAFLAFPAPQSSPDDPNEPEVPDASIWSDRVPNVADTDIDRGRMPSRKFAIAARNGAEAAWHRGMRSIVSQFQDGRRYPIWAAIFWVEAISQNAIRQQYMDAQRSLRRASLPRDETLVSRLLQGWKTFRWSTLHPDLTAGDHNSFRPDPHSLLPLIYGQEWLEDEQMDLLIKMLGHNMREAKAPGVVLPIQFWRELEILDRSASQSKFLERTWNEIRSDVDVGFILNSSAGSGSHWTACIFNKDKNEFRFGNSMDGPPPPALLQRLAKWTRINGRTIPPRQGRDLRHGTQTDGHSCGPMAINTLEHHFLHSDLWAKSLEMNIRLTNYINLMEYNGPGRGNRLSPPRSRRHSGATSHSTSSSHRAERPDQYFAGDNIPFLGDDARVARSWHPEEGFREGSRYQAARVTTPEHSRSRASSTASTGPRLRTPSLRKPVPRHARTLEMPSVSSPYLTVPGAPPSLPPSEESPGSRRAQREPLDRPGFERREVYQDGRIHYEYHPFNGIIPFPDRQEEERTRANPVLRSQPLNSPQAQPRSRRDDPIFPAAEFETQPTQPVFIPPPNYQRDTPPPYPRMTSDRGPAVFPVFPITPPDTRNDRVWPGSQNVHPFPSREPAAPVIPSPLLDQRSRTDSNIPTNNNIPRSRQNSQSQPSVWGAMKKTFSRSRAGSGLSFTGVPSPSPSVNSADSRTRDDFPESESDDNMSDEEDDVENSSRGRPTSVVSLRPQMRARKSSLKSMERGNAQPRARGLSVTFDKDVKPGPDSKASKRDISREDARRERAINTQTVEPIKERRKLTKEQSHPSMPQPPSSSAPSLYTSVEYVPTPEDFTFNDEAIPPEWKQDAIESRYYVHIDVEPRQLKVTGARFQVSEACRELFKAVSLFKTINASEEFSVTERAALRIGLWALHKRLQEETHVTINVSKDRLGLIRVSGRKELLRPARDHILRLAKAIDQERRKQFVMRYSRGLRAFLMTELPRIITACGGPKDEDEARQLFTISNPDERQRQPIEMEINMWCHPNIAAQFNDMLKDEIQNYTLHLATEVWMLRVPSWKLHALQNSHIFQSGFRSSNSPETMEDWAARSQIEIYWPDQGKEPRWALTGPFANALPAIKSSSDQIVKLKGSHAQAPVAFSELEDRLKKLVQVTLRIPLTFRAPLEGPLGRLQKMAVNVEQRPLSDDSNGAFECTLSATSKEDLDAGQKEIGRMVDRIKKNQPP